MSLYTAEASVPSVSQLNQLDIKITGDAFHLLPHVSHLILSNPVDKDVSKIGQKKFEWKSLQLMVEDGHICTKTTSSFFFLLLSPY